MNNNNLDLIKNISILDVANKLGIEIRGSKAMCFDGHDSKTPSLSFFIKKNLWRCFGCGKHGDNITLVREVEKCDFKSALNWFVDFFFVDINKNEIDINNRFRNRSQTLKKHKASNPIIEPEEFSPDSEIYLWLLEKCSKVGCITGINYLKNHGISLNVAAKFGISELINPRKIFNTMIEHWGSERVYKSGLALKKNGNLKQLFWSSYTLLIPFFEDNNIIYLQGRQFEGKSKFLNLCGIPKPIFNINCLKSNKRGATIHICEGIPDALALESRGKKAVAILGATSFRAEWVDLFIPFDIILCPDGDKGGESFRKQTTQFFEKRGKLVRTLTLPNGKDIADIIAKMENPT